jgi:hypothetical protein
MKWKNELSHRKIIATNFKIHTLKLSVHHYVHCGETWFVSCAPFFHKHELPPMSLDNAKIAAIDLIKNALKAELENL